MKNSKLAAERLQRIDAIAEHLKSGEYTVEEISGKFGCSGTAVNKYMHVLMDIGKARISGWRKNGRGAAAIYTAGPGSNAPRPISDGTSKIMTDEEYERCEAARLEKERQRIADWEPRMDPLVAAFFGSIQKIYFDGGM